LVFSDTKTPKPGAAVIRLAFNRTASKEGTVRCAIERTKANYPLHSDFPDLHSVFPRDDLNAGDYGIPTAAESA